MLLAEPYRLVTNPVGGSVALSAVFAVLPLVTLFVLLGGLRVKAWLSGVISLLVALLVAIFAYGMPVGQGLLSASEGAVFGFFPILWVVINAIWVYNLTVKSGHFEVLRRSFGKVSKDLRIMAVIIAFCFGGLLEALAGFGTPVAISVVMLMGLGLKPIKAAVVALIANTAPVAFGALATPIITLASVTSGVAPEVRGLNVDTLGAMAGRQTPILAAVVPLVLVYVVDGKRGLRQTWLPALVAGVSFGVAQWLTANYISVPLTDIVASLVGAAAVVALLKVWQPAETITVDERDMEPATAGGGGGTAARAAGGSGAAVGTEGGRGGDDLTTVDAAGGTTRTDGGRVDDDVRDSGGQVALAYAPYLIIIAIFSVANYAPIKAALAVPPWTIRFPWPGLEVLTAAGRPQSSATFTFNWFASAGSLMILAGLVTMLVLKVSVGRALKTYGETLYELRFAILTVMAVLGLAYVMNQSGQTATLGVLLAGTGYFFAFLSPILGWIGVAVTGSDTSANALFGALQVQTAGRVGLDPVLLAAANSSGGVMGKMVSPQNLAIAASAVGLSGQEGEIFRRVIGWSLVLLLFMCVLVVLQAFVFTWMIPSY
ncbi:MAG: L-lactate permease [Actinomycetota bacterium]|nr:L-lactate permease [Actinomycetota bacterium]